MNGAVFVTFAALTLSPTPGAPGPSPDPRPAAMARPAIVSHPREPANGFRSEELYALRARRRMAGYLRLRLLELREEGLARAAEIVERRYCRETGSPCPARSPRFELLAP